MKRNTSVNIAIEQQDDGRITLQDMEAMYLEFLSSQGFPAKKHEEGVIHFKSEGHDYLIYIDPSDPQFFTILFPAFWPIEDEAEMQRAMEAASYSNGKSKVAKVFLNGDSVWASVELFFSRPEEFKGVFLRSLRALMNGVVNFAQYMRGEQ